MANCELGNHQVAAHELKWCCQDCVEVYRKNRNEIAKQAELDRQFTVANRRSPYRLVPYYALTLVFAAFFAAFFL